LHALAGTAAEGEDLMAERNPRLEEPADDVERLLVRLEPVPPAPHLTARVLAHTTRRARLRWGLWVGLAVGVGLLTAVVAAISGYFAGQEFVRSGAYDLVGLALEDWDLVAAAPGEYLLALAGAVPWASALATLASVAAAYAVTRPLARASALLRAATGAPG
jgi:hypothetical protein